MKQLLFSARTLGAPTEEYLPLQQQGLMAQEHISGGDGTPLSPLCREVTVTNQSGERWQGVIRIALPLDMPAPRYFLPGYMYGTNRGEAPLVVDSPAARLRETEEFPASPWWLTRSDRLSHPVALAFGQGRVVGFSATPYVLHTTKGRQAWQPGVEGSFDQYMGFGCSLSPRELVYTLGYENAPWFFLESHQSFPRKPLGENVLTLAAGEQLTITLHCFDYEAADERGITPALRWVYDRYHEQPRRCVGVQLTVEQIAGAIARDAWLKDVHSYAGFVFDRGDHFEYRALPSISWTNGLAAAVPMLQASVRLGDSAMRAQAIDCINHIAENSLNPASGLPYMVEQEGVWSNRGWWYDRQRTPGHAAYLVGQSVYLILKAYHWEKEHHSTEHAQWLRFALDVIRRTEMSRNSDGEYPYILSDKTGAGLEYDSFSGAWLMTAAAYAAYLTGDHSRLPALLKSESWYHRAYITPMECYGGPLDIDKQTDSEGILAYIRAVRYLHAITGDDMLLDHLHDALQYEFTFKFCYNSPIKVPPLSTVGWSSCGGSITSVVNPHIHPMSSSVLDEMYYYLSCREDAHIRSRLADTLWWSCQNHNTRDGEFGYGKTGWMSERFCHSEGLVKERYPDGTLASTWFALMPWACGSILEGLCGEAWEKPME